ncbi:MAG: hypothetical protein EPN20_03630 [Magnetospirillum sp.]|nr:MAG: hypothetical protein EPN20_03630 [Magnetospirillum sp.]
MALSGEVLFEFRRIGNAVKVMAFHTESLTEISVVGPATATEAHLKMMAIKRLEYVLAKRKD